LTGTPDLVLKIPRFTSNAVTQDAFDCFSLPTGLTQDRYIMAYEIVAGNPAIVHHVTIHVDSTGTFASDLSGNCSYTSGYPILGAYAPGTEPSVFPSSPPLKLGIRIKAGSNIILQIHYPLGSGGQVDSTEIRLFFYPAGTTGIRPIHLTAPLRNGTMTIPADSVKSYTVTSFVHNSMSVFAVFPHSHKIDTSIKVWAVSSYDTIPLIRINNWNFNWQGFYVYHHLVKITAGHMLVAKHVFNNTTRNPANPYSPPKTITNGPATTDEMIVDAFQWIDYQPGDEKINIDSMLNAENIVSGFSETTNVESHISVYPNPSNGIYTLTSDSGPLGLITVYNLFGQLVCSEKSVAASKEMNLTNVPPGIYIIQVKDMHLRVIKQ
jgi:hypothetical protein